MNRTLCAVIAGMCIGVGGCQDLPNNHMTTNKNAFQRPPEFYIELESMNFKGIDYSKVKKNPEKKNY